MHYRTILVDDQEYEFMVGSAFVNIKGVGTVDRDQIGELVWIDDVPKIMITQQHVADWIRKEKAKGLPSVLYESTSLSQRVNS